MAGTSNNKCPRCGQTYTCSYSYIIDGTEEFYCEHCTPVTCIESPPQPLTEQRLREIIREELALAMPALAQQVLSTPLPQLHVHDTIIGGIKGPG